MKFRVTRADIKKAIQMYGAAGRDCRQSCPIACALKRKLKKKVSVFPCYDFKRSDVRVYSKFVEYYRLGDSANEQALNFDKNLEFKPGWYELLSEVLF